MQAALDRCCDPAVADPEPHVAAVLAHVPTEVSISDLLRLHMGPYLVHSDGKVRGRATNLLYTLLQRGGSAVLRPASASSDEQTVIAAKAVAKSLLDFFTGRLADYPSMGPAADALAVLLESHGDYLPDDAASTVSGALYKELTIPAMDVTSRHKLLSLLRIIVRTERWLLDVGRDCKAFGAGVVTAVEGEKDPRCLVVAMEIVQRTLARFAGALEAQDGGNGVIEELFDVMACYFPISFTPPAKDPHGITRAMLVDGLRGVLCSTYRLAPLVFPLAFEKLSSSIASAKLDAMGVIAGCAVCFGPCPPLLAHVREALDSLRNEAVHGTSSDAHVTQEALNTITAIARCLTSELAVAGEDGSASLPSPPSTVEPSVPGWSDVTVSLVNTSLGDVMRSPDSLLGRAGANVLAAVAASSGYAYAKVLSVLSPLLTAVFDVSKRAEHRTGAVQALQVIAASPATSEAAAAALTHVRWMDVRDTLTQIADVFTSVLVTPGGARIAGGSSADASSSLCAAVKGIVAVALATKTLPPHTVQHIVDVYNSAAATALKQACVEGLCALAAPGAFEADVLSVAVPAYLAAVTTAATAIDTPLTTPGLTASLHVLSALCDNQSVYRVVVPQLVACCRADGAATVLRNTPACVEIVSAAASIVASSQAVRRDSACADECAAAPDGLLVLLRQSALAETTAVASAVWSPLAYKVMQAMALYGSGSLQQALREDVVGAVLTCDVATDPTSAVELRVSWLIASLSSRGRLHSIPQPQHLTRKLLALALLTDTTTSIDSGTGRHGEVAEASCQALAGVLNRIGKSPSTELVDECLHSLIALVRSATTPPQQQQQALKCLVWVLTGLYMCGSRSSTLGPALDALCECAGAESYAASPANAMLAGAGLANMLTTDACDALMRELGAVVSPVYKQKLFLCVFGRLADGRLPSLLSPAEALALCGMTANIPAVMLQEYTAKVLPYILVSLSSEQEDTRVAGVNALRLLTQHAVDIVTPHLFSIVPQLLNMAVKAKKAVVRAEAIECLQSFVTLPFHQLNPLRASVVRGLQAALDDPKRGVRRRAAAARNEWITLSTTPV